jgi:hypothetical protein
MVLVCTVLYTTQKFLRYVCKITSIYSEGNESLGRQRNTFSFCFLQNVLINRDAKMIFNLLHRAAIYEIGRFLHKMPRYYSTDSRAKSIQNIIQCGEAVNGLTLPCSAAPAIKLSKSSY